MRAAGWTDALACAAVANDGTDAEPAAAPISRAKVLLENEFFKTVLPFGPIPFFRLLKMH
jgi:hypothetical protein